MATDNTKAEQWISHLRMWVPFCQILPDRRASAIVLADALLITLTTYNGQLAWLAMVTERCTASLSTYKMNAQRRLQTGTERERGGGKEK